MMPMPNGNNGNGGNNFRIPIPNGGGNNGYMNNEDDNYRIPMPGGNDNSYIMSPIGNNPNMMSPNGNNPNMMSPNGNNPNMRFSNGGGNPNMMPPNNGNPNMMYSPQPSPQRIPSNTSTPYGQPMPGGMNSNNSLNVRPLPQQRLSQEHLNTNQNQMNSSANSISTNNKVKKVQLYRGNYIVNCPVPDGVFAKAYYKRGSAEEFDFLRYSAVTCDPNEFEASNFTLRQQIWKRETELFIVLTMYNEDEILFARSMSSVMENITYMCNKDKKWEMEGWKKVVVCIVSDGRKKINDRVLNMLEFMGAYQEGVMKEKVNGKNVQAHVFEYTTQVFLDTKMTEKGTSENYVPVQILFCLKEQNKKKINSHRWFFNAFGRILKPNVCVLIDVGTRPSSTSIHSLWKVFDKDKQVAGACGEIKCDLGKYWSNLKNPLVATQHFEYKMSNILDKPLESTFGYISVLPGAFSAYRFEALQGQPLEAYFKGETLHEQPDGSLFKSNMYLAEDRILCFELVAKKNNNYILKYVRSATAETDVPDNVPEFISQRRRWLNGSFFASLYSTYNWMEVYKTNHSLGRKFVFCIEFIYNLVNLLFSWFNLANFFLTFYFLAGSVSDNAAGAGLTFLADHGDTIFLVMETIYLYAIICIFICSLGNRPQGSRVLYLACIILFAILMVFMLFLSGLTIFQVIKANQDKTVAEIFENPAIISMILSLVSTYGLYFISSFLHLQPAHMFTSFIQYLLLLPSFVNILMVYAFCNTHDVSWGTKGSTDVASSKLGSVTAKPGENIQVELPSREDVNSHYEKLLPELKKEKIDNEKTVDINQSIQDGKQNFRTYMVLFWIFCNTLLLITIISVFDEEYLLGGTGPNGESTGRFNPYLQFIFYSVLFLSAVRFVGSSYYLVDNILN